MFRKIQKTLFYSLLTYAIFGFFILPFILKSQLIDIVQKETNSKIAIQSVYFNPFVFKLQISGVELKTLDGKHLLELKSLLLNIEAYSLLNSVIHIKDFILDQPEITLIYNKDKSLNFYSLIKKDVIKIEKVDDAKESKLPRILLDRVAIKAGTLNYEDFTNKSKFDFVFHDMGFELQDIDTYDFNSSNAKLRFYSSLGDGGFVDLKTNIIGFKPLALDGSLNFKSSKLYTQWRYMKDILNIEIADGKLSFSADYHFNIADMNNTTLSHLNATLSHLRIKPKYKYKDILNLDSFYIADATIKPLLKDVHVKKIGIKSLYAKVNRDNKGNIDWTEYIKTKLKTSQNSAVKDKNSFKWKVVVDEVAIQKVKADFYDEGVKPKVDTKLDELNLHLHNVTLAGIEPITYQMNMKLNDTLSCNSEGKIIGNALNIQAYTKCREFNVIHYRPYIDEIAKKFLKVYDVKLQRAKIGFDANVNIQNVASKIVVYINNADLNVDNLILNKKSTGERLIQFNSLNANGINLNTKTKDVLVDTVELNRLNIQAKRLKKGTLNLEELIVPRKADKKKKNKEKISKEKEYKISLKHFALNSATLNFNDKFLSPNVKSTIDKIRLNAYDISSEKHTSMKYNLSLRVNSKGYIKSKGKIQHTPFEQKGTLDLKRISIKEFTPYLQQSTYLNLDDGFVSLKSNMHYLKSKKLPDIKIDGSLNLENIFVSDSRDKSLLFSLNNIGLNSFTFELFPNRLFINKIDISSFYVNALVDKNRVMNFSSLVKKKKVVQDKDKNSSTHDEDKFIFQVMKVNVADGSAIFADKSLPINFKTNIHDINGVTYLISNNNSEISYINMLGEVDKYGETSLEGSITLSNPKSYTDINLNFENIDLNNLSGYSASFVGYKIDSGKIYLDLGYNIIDSQLSGKNSIIIKKINLGDKFEDSNTSLPLRLAIALLEDSNGIINIDMPVKGNVDEPNFKYGALVFKTVVKLIVQAVASPFKFIGSMLGLSSDELEFIGFKPGKYKITPPQREKLDSIAKMMQTRSKISLNFTASYDAKLDKKMLQQEKLMLTAMKKSGIKNSKYNRSMLTTDLLEEIYEDAKDDKKLQMIKKDLKAKYKGKIFVREYIKALIDACASLQSLTKEELKVLAKKRANSIKNYLVNIKGIMASRIIVTAVEAVNDDEKIVKTKLEVEIRK